MIETEVYLTETSRIFLKFKHVIGEEFWIKRVTIINEEIRGYPYLNEYLIEENFIAYALTHYSDLIKKYGVIPRRERNRQELYPAISFMVQTLSFIDTLPETQRQRFIRRVQSVFRNTEDLRGLLFEFKVATHFIRESKNVTWPDVDTVGTPDLLIKDIGTNGLEIECKSVSKDKGRKIPPRDALEFFNFLRDKLMRHLAASSFQGGMSVVVTVQDRLCKSPKVRQNLADNVLKAIENSVSQILPDGSEVSISQFDLALMAGVELKIQSKQVRLLVDELSLTENREVMICGYSEKAVIMVLQSGSDDAPIKYLFETLSKSAKKQLTKTRPAVYMVEFPSISPDELINIANHDLDSNNSPTGLRIGVTNFLSNTNRKHIIGVGFMSNGEIEIGADGVHAGSGATYFFPQKTSEFWHDDFTGMFSPPKSNSLRL